MFGQQHDEIPKSEHHATTSIDSNQLIYVIDDDTNVRKSLHFVLSTFEVTSWPFACAIDFLDHLPSLQPAPILVDMRMANIDGIKLMEILLERGINWPVIVMTAHADIPTAVQAVKLGALEFLEKPFDLELLRDSVQLALAQLPTLNQVENIRCNARRLFESLSRREIEVMSVLTEGVSNKAAAFRLSLSVRTVEMHRANAFGKLKVKNIAEVVRLAHAGGINLASHK